ncbi:methyltransferase family protein [Aspergillus luchuensis]|uniref:Methyltransferase family protein n=1 Tax=Aspergillus kawachii TaxID=1069201 RepID=A0A146FDL7_ASPKA|nr:methyltransferase family protein [Aspergillus luchuensis]
MSAGDLMGEVCGDTGAGLPNDERAKRGNLGTHGSFLPSTLRLPCRVQREHPFWLLYTLGMLVQNVDLTD